MELLIGLTIGVAGGWILRMVFDKNEREKTTEAKREAYLERCTAQSLQDDAMRIRRAARVDAEFVEKVLVSQSRPFQR